MAMFKFASCFINWLKPEFSHEFSYDFPIFPRVFPRFSGNLAMVFPSKFSKLPVLPGAAQLMNADVLMLDEPTGHLDVDNIKWLEDSGWC